MLKERQLVIFIAMRSRLLPAELALQEQMDIISHLCDDRYSSLIEGESGSALLAFHLQSSNTAGIVDIQRQDHPAVPYKTCANGVAASLSLLFSNTCGLDKTLNMKYIISVPIAHSRVCSFIFCNLFQDHL
jgi:hypothetical protein